MPTSAGLRSHFPASSQYFLLFFPPSLWPNSPRFILRLHPITPSLLSSFVQSSLQKIPFSRYGSTQHARHQTCPFTWVPGLRLACHKRERQVIREKAEPTPALSLHSSPVVTGSPHHNLIRLPSPRSTFLVNHSHLSSFSVEYSCRALRASTISNISNSVEQNLARPRVCAPAEL
jgi:serine/threonine protein kinase